MDIKIRLTETLRALSLISAYAVLCTVSIFVFRQFFNVIIPRIWTIIRNGPVLNTPPCQSPECDFSVFWPAGLLARAGRLHEVYQPDAFLIWRHDVLFAGAQRLDWFYPPPSLLPVMAISYLPFNAAFAVWTLAFIAGAVIVLRWAGLPWSVTALGLLSPAALWTIEMGQFEIITDAFLVAGLLAAARSPFRAGGILGLLVFKPQTALLVPFAMIASGNRRAIAGGGLLAATILGLATWLLGPGVWQDYLTNGLVTSRLTLTSNTVGFERGVAVFWMVRSLGAGLPLCYAAQILAALMAAMLTWQVWRQKEVDAVERMSITVFLTMLATPYGYVDDMVAYSFALAALARARNWRIDMLDVLFWLWPALCPIVFTRLGILLTPAVVALAALRCWRRMNPGHFAAPGKRLAV